MADDIFKGLLDKSPGTSFGELAASYFQRGRKRDNRARNLLVASLFFNAAEQRRQANVLQKLQDVEDRQLGAVANAKANYKKYMDLLAADKDIKEQSAIKYFDAKAENWFNDPNNHDDGFDPREFEDSTTPLYRFKQNKKKDYINNVLMPEHQLKMKSVEGIEAKSEEDFISPVKDAFKAEKRKVSSPQNVSLVHKAFGAIGIGDDEKYQQDYLKAKKEMDVLNQKIEDIDTKTLYRYKDSSGKVVSVDPNMIDTGYSIELVNPEAYYKGKTADYIPSVEGVSDQDVRGQLQRLGVTTEDLTTGFVSQPTYTLFEFRSSDGFKSLKSAVARKNAIDRFNSLKEENRTEDELNTIIVSAVAADAYQQRIAVFNAIKNENKPEMPLGMSEEDFKKTEAYINWENSYKPGGSQYVTAREEANLPVSNLEKQKDSIRELMIYDKQVMAKQAELEEDKNLSAEQRQKQLTEFKNQRFQEHVETYANSILADGGLDAFLDGYVSDQFAVLDSWILSSAGQEAIKQHAADNDISTVAAETRIRNYRTYHIFKSRLAYEEMYNKYGTDGLDIDIDALGQDLEGIDFTFDQ